MNLRLMLGILGKLLIGYSLTMFLPLSIAALSKDSSFMAFLISSLATGLTGVLMLYWRKSSGRMGVREGFAIVAAA